MAAKKLWQPITGKQVGWSRVANGKRLRVLFVEKTGKYIVTVDGARLADAKGIPVDTTNKVYALRVAAKAAG